MLTLQMTVSDYNEIQQWDESFSMFLMYNESIWILFKCIS